MKDEAKPISDDEWLLRRVRVERFRTGEIPVISPGAFEPRIKGRDIDATGISFYREGCLSSVEEVLNLIPPEKRQHTGIVRVRVSALRQLGVTIRAEPDDRIRGHVVIPELNASNYEQAPRSFDRLKLELARLASENISVWPKPDV